MQMNQTNKNAGDVNNNFPSHHDYRTEVTPLANLVEACEALDKEGWDVVSLIGPMAVASSKEVVLTTGIGAVPIGCLILAKRKAKVVK